MQPSTAHFAARKQSSRRTPWLPPAQRSCVFPISSSKPPWTRQRRGRNSLALLSRVARFGGTGFSLCGLDFRWFEKKGAQAEACPTKSPAARRRSRIHLNRAARHIHSAFVRTVDQS